MNSYLIYLSDYFPKALSFVEWFFYHPLPPSCLRRDRSLEDTEDTEGFREEPFSLVLRAFVTSVVMSFFSPTGLNIE
jgi:hypothetical protein